MTKATKNNRINIGLIGFGRTGQSVASVTLKDPNFDLKWVLRKTKTFENELVSEILNIDSNN